MGTISVMSYGLDSEKPKVLNCGDQEIIYVSDLCKKGRLKRFISKNKVDRVVLKGSPPKFIEKELEKAGVTLCTGENFVKSVYEKLIRRTFKTLSDFDTCTVYDTEAGDFTLNVIVCASKYFRHVSLCAPADNGRIFQDVMDLTGMALKNGDIGGVKILCRGEDNDTAHLNLTKLCKATFLHDSAVVFTPDIAEAMAKGDFSGDVLERLNLKINSLC